MGRLLLVELDDFVADLELHAGDDAFDVCDGHVIFDGIADGDAADDGGAAADGEGVAFDKFGASAAVDDDEAGVFLVFGDAGDGWLSEDELLSFGETAAAGGGFGDASGFEGGAFSFRGGIVEDVAFAFFHFAGGEFWRGSAWVGGIDGGAGADGGAGRGVRVDFLARRGWGSGGFRDVGDGGNDGRDGGDGRGRSGCGWSGGGWLILDAFFDGTHLFDELFIVGLLFFQLGIHVRLDGQVDASREERAETGESDVLEFHGGERGGRGEVRDGGTGKGCGG